MRLPTFTKAQKFKIAGTALCSIGGAAIVSTIVLGCGHFFGEGSDITALKSLANLSHQAYESGMLPSLFASGMVSYFAGCLALLYSAVDEQVLRISGLNPQDFTRDRGISRYRGILAISPGP